MNMSSHEQPNFMSDPECQLPMPHEYEAVWQQFAAVVHERHTEQTVHENELPAFQDDAVRTYELPLPEEAGRTLFLLDNDVIVDSVVASWGEPVYRDEDDSETYSPVAIDATLRLPHLVDGRPCIIHKSMVVTRCYDVASGEETYAGYQNTQYAVVGEDGLERLLGFDATADAETAFRNAVDGMDYDLMQADLMRMTAALESAQS